MLNNFSKTVLLPCWKHDFPNTDSIFAAERIIKGVGKLQEFPLVTRKFLNTDTEFEVPYSFPNFCVFFFK